MPLIQQCWLEARQIGIRATMGELSAQIWLRLLD
jgi:hypothetical protein